MATATGPLPEISPESFWRDVFHVDCPEPPRCGIMKHLPDRLPIEDGSVLRGFECLNCGARLFAGLDAGRRVVRRPFAG